MKRLGRGDVWFMSLGCTFKFHLSTFPRCSSALLFSTWIFMLMAVYLLVVDFDGVVEGVMFNSASSPARLKRVLLWPEPPRALGSSGSYILSLLSKEVLVHKLKTTKGARFQHISLREVACSHIHCSRLLLLQMCYPEFSLFKHFHCRFVTNPFDLISCFVAISQSHG